MSSEIKSEHGRQPLVDAALDDFFATAEAQAVRLAQERAEKSAAARLDRGRRWGCTHIEFQLTTA
jgi:hypothetical protein